MTIPKDHISFNDDDTAWWVSEPIFNVDDLAWFKAFDRPCDTCGEVSPWLTNIVPCKDCDGAGRHTFDIVVADRLLPHLPFATYRVSIIPGMVLPIVKRQPISHYSALDEGESVRVVQRALPVPSGVIVEYTNHSGQVVDGMTLPAAAVVGQWAVKLKVAQ